MKVLSFLALAVFLVVVGCSKNDTDQQTQTSQSEETTIDEKLIYYTCPMESHKHIHSAEPGKCPECNMELVKAVTTSEQKMEFYGCPMEAHSHIRSDKPGKCDECSMTLKPMRLEKKM
jgi:hypothetical protein